MYYDCYLVCFVCTLHSNKNVIYLPSSIGLLFRSYDEHSMYVRIYIMTTYVRTCVRAYACTCVCVCVYGCMYVCVCVYTCIHSHTYASVWAYVYTCVRSVIKPLSGTNVDATNIRRCREGTCHLQPVCECHVGVIRSHMCLNVQDRAPRRLCHRGRLFSPGRPVHADTSRTLKFIYKYIMLLIRYSC